MLFVFLLPLILLVNKYYHDILEKYSHVSHKNKSFGRHQIRRYRVGKICDDAEFLVCSVAHAFVHQDTLAYVLFTAGHVDPFEAMSYNNRIPRRRGVLFLWLSGWVV